MKLVKLQACFCLNAIFDLLFKHVCLFCVVYFGYPYTSCSIVCHHRSVKHSFHTITTDTHFVIVQTPCGHNFCLKCFNRWIHNGKRTCGTCRALIPSKMAEQPRINSTIVEAIRMAKISKNANNSAGSSAAPYHYIRNDDRPDKAYTTERAKRAGKANASSGQIFVIKAPDHFGPILAEHDPIRNTGVRVGETWEDRFECRQWGAHLPHIAGLAGQGRFGAQSVAISGGYEDDEDHGDWFLYTGRYNNFTA